MFFYFNKKTLTDIPLVNSIVFLPLVKGGEGGFDNSVIKLSDLCNAGTTQIKKIRQPFFPCSF